MGLLKLHLLHEIVFIAWECSIWNCIIINLNRKAKCLWKLKHCYICVGVWVEKDDYLVQDKEGTCSGHRNSMEQTLLWHQDWNDLMFYVVLKHHLTWKWFFIHRTYFSLDALTALNILHITERNKPVSVGGLSSAQLWSFSCQFWQTVPVGSTTAPLPGKSLCHPGVILGDYSLPRSFLARGSFHYRNWSLLWVQMNWRLLNQNFGVARFQNSQNWFREINSCHSSQGLSF